ATQVLRNGASVVVLSQESGGILVHGGEVRLLLHADNALAAVSGTLLPQIAKQTFTSTADAALGRALDEIFGSSRATPAIAPGAERGGWQELAVASGGDLHVTNARARRELAKVDGGFAPVWAVEVLGLAPGRAGTDPSITVPMARRLLIN